MATRKFRLNIQIICGRMLLFSAAAGPGMESTSNMASIGKRLVSKGAEAIEAVEMLRITGSHCLHRVYNDLFRGTDDLSGSIPEQT